MGSSKVEQASTGQQYYRYHVLLNVYPLLLEAEEKNIALDFDFLIDYVRLYLYELLLGEFAGKIDTQWKIRTVDKTGLEPFVSSTQLRIVVDALESEAQYIFNLANKLEAKTGIATNVHSKPNTVRTKLSASPSPSPSTSQTHPRPESPAPTTPSPRSPVA